MHRKEDKAEVVFANSALTIRKFTSRHYTVDDLIARGTLTRPLADFLAEQIRSRKTLLISGGTGTGKTTLLRILAGFIPDQERLVVIEDTSELQMLATGPDHHGRSAWHRGANYAFASPCKSR